MAKKHKKPYIPPSLHNKMECEEYIKDLPAEQQEWIRKFYYDYYAGGVYKEDSVLENEEAKKEARKNHNSLRRDAFQVSENMGALGDLTEADREFMEDAHDEWDWERIYIRDGYRAAVEEIIRQTTNDLDNEYIEKRVTLLRFYEKMSKLARKYKYDRSQKRKQK
jgi:hypothetical protein